MFAALQYKGANIQLLDLPGIIEGAAQGKAPMFSVFKTNIVNVGNLEYILQINNTWSLLGKGRGRQVIAVARTADVVIMMLDATKGDVQRCVCVCVRPPLSVFKFEGACEYQHHLHYAFDFFSISRELLEKELESVGIRLNRTKPNIYFKVRFLLLFLSWPSVPAKLKGCSSINIEEIQTDDMADWPVSVLLWLCQM